MNAFTDFNPEFYTVGDLILVNNGPLRSGGPGKVQPRLKGTFAITTVLINDRNVVEDRPCFQSKQCHYRSKYASDGLKP